MNNAAAKQILGESLAAQATVFFKKRGSDLNSAIRNFVQNAVSEEKQKTTLEEGRNAFYELRRQAEKNGLQGMSLEEINKEITLARMGM